MYSVGHAYSILKGPNFRGNRDRAKEFLESLPTSRRIMQNRAESRMRARVKKKKNLKLGHKPTPRRAV